MSVKALVVGLAAVVWAVPAAAQMRGTMEFGAFASAATFDRDLTLNTGFGGGGRIGMFLEHRWSVEFEKSEMRASRPNGLANVNVGVLAGRLVVAPFGTSAVTFLFGGGPGTSTETNFLHSYGVDLMAGARIHLKDNASLRIDGVWDWLANNDWKTYKTIHLGLSLYRHPIERNHGGASRTAPPITVASSDSARTLPPQDVIKQ